MYANKSHRVFIFEINTPSVRDDEGNQGREHRGAAQASVWVGAQEAHDADLLHLLESGGTSNRTDFYVSRTTKKIARVLISRY